MRITSIKYSFIFWLSITISVLILAAGCKRKPINFRKKYVGTFDFTKTMACWTLNNGATPPVTTDFVGEVTHEAGFEKEKRDLIKIHFEENTTRVFHVDKGGVIFSACGYSVGIFDDRNNLKLDLTDDGCGVPAKGGGCSVLIVGSRIKK